MMIDEAMGAPAKAAEPEQEPEPSFMANLMNYLSPHKAAERALEPEPETDVTSVTPSAAMARPWSPEDWCDAIHAGVFSRASREREIFSNTKQLQYIYTHHLGPGACLLRLVTECFFSATLLSPASEEVKHRLLIVSTQAADRVCGGLPAISSFQRRRCSRRRRRAL